MVLYNVYCTLYTIHVHTVLCCATIRPPTYLPPLCKYPSENLRRYMCELPTGIRNTAHYKEATKRHTPSKTPPCSHYASQPASTRAFQCVSLPFVLSCSPSLLPSVSPSLRPSIYSSLHLLVPPPPHFPVPPSLHLSVEVLGGQVTCDGMLPLVTVRQQLLLVVQQLLVCLRGVPAEEERERRRSRGEEQRRRREERT